MKLAKLSLAAIVVAGLATSSFAADTLEGAFKEGKVSGTIKSLYRDWSGAQDTNGFAVGGELGYVTGSLKGFSMGATFQTSHTLGMKENNPLEVDGSVAVSKTSLSEMYLAYACDITKSVIKVGRQYIDTPLVSSSTTRMFNDSFQGATIVNSYFADTTLVAGVVNKMQARFADMDDIENIIPGSAKNIYTLYMLNKSVKGLELTAQMTFHKDDRNLLFVDAAYELPTAFPLTVGAQYVGDYADVAGEDDSSMYGVMVGTKVAGFGLSAYYNTTDKDGDVSTGYGQGTDWTYNSVQWLTGTTAGTDSYQGKISYDFAQVGVPGLTAFVRYSVFDNSVVAANDADEWDFDMSYKFSGAAKGLDLRVRYADINYDLAGKDNEKDFRVIANYKF